MKNVARFPIPPEPLWAVFTPEVLSALNSRRTLSNDLRQRLRILAAGAHDDTSFARRRRAFKSAWEAYFAAAFAIGMFEGADGKDLMNRLRGYDDAAFRGALSECLVAWYLAGKLGLPVEVRPEGMSGRPLDLVIHLADGDINVEVKASYREIPDSGFFHGDDRDLLERDLRKANSQFKKGDRNLLVLVPMLRIGIDSNWRIPLEAAFIGDTKIAVPINLTTGEPVGDVSVAFFASGQLTRQGKEPPRFTSVSAVLCLVEQYENGIEHLALMLRNPNAIAPISGDGWEGIAEFVRRDGRWQWTDTGKAGL